MEKLILRCSWSPGDIVMLTAAVRDLHRAYPGRFLTDVRTSCPDLWENNPDITPLSETDPGVVVVDCEVPLIRRSNQIKEHYLYGFIDFLNQKLALEIALTEKRGAIYLTESEKSCTSLISEKFGIDEPFWLLVSGGKSDATVKWWHPERFQEVVDRLAGRALFAQVGQVGDYHPRIKGTVDLRGKTSLRELICLVYHASGVLCPVTAIMHFAAALETRKDGTDHRPCVVLAGGREPVSWEKYPQHDFLSSIGSMSCCEFGGCWRSRVYPLGDGSDRDLPEKLCLRPRGTVAGCMDRISSGDVVQRIEKYVVKAKDHPKRSMLSAIQSPLLESNGFGTWALTEENVRPYFERFATIAAPRHYDTGSKGIVICAGGPIYTACAWVCVRMLRHWGCAAPIEVWSFGPEEFPQEMVELFRGLGVESRFAPELDRKKEGLKSPGWVLKSYAVWKSRFQRLLLLDADNVAIRDPSFLFSEPHFQRSSAVFWADIAPIPEENPIWRLCGVDWEPRYSLESGQALFDKSKCGRALSLALWMNLRSEFFYRYLLGDKDTFLIAFRKLGLPFYVIQSVSRLKKTLCQNDFKGERLFQHRNGAKWIAGENNLEIPGFLHEDLCLRYLEEFRRHTAGFSHHHQVPSNSSTV